MKQKSEEGVKSLQLSYSSMTEIATCQQKYVHRKILGTPRDVEDDEEALNIGKAFHQILEKGMHKAVHEEYVKAACEEFKVEDKIELIRAMATKNVELHIASGLRTVKVELGIGDTKSTGFIDAIFVDDALKQWWIGDEKTAARFDENLLPRLPLDPQLNRYAAFADSMQEFLPELNGFVFAGARYRVTTKPKLKNATFDKLLAAVDVYDIVIPAKAMNPAAITETFNQYHDIALGLHNGVVPVKNFKACFDYFRPCPYFSQCHGKKFDEAATDVEIRTIKSYKEIDCL